VLLRLLTGAVGEPDGRYQLIDELEIEELLTATLPEPLKELEKEEFDDTTLKPPATAASSASFSSTGSSSTNFSITFPLFESVEERGEDNRERTLSHPHIPRSMS
jgi:hypothetical protein